ncbi:SDR family NAD(P)-dependent oxidoreductase [Streptomyces sp. NPDC026672]|uniref:SDR family NAD(P)-dependent oxidoreductase n=1 Tax=unclassified Streptomyces TaxID=2593676 RepID=UPI0033ED55F6
MKTWLITGAGRGLGLETARAALAAGDQVVATGRKPESVSAALGTDNERLLTVALDVTDERSIEAAVQAAVDRFGRIDVLINNAGYGQLGAFEEHSAAAVERQFATNVFGVFAVTRAVLPTMRAQRSGHIITVSSICGLVGFNNCSIYSAAKFAVGGWSESLSIELAPFGISATVLYPGTFRTDFLEQGSYGTADLSIDDYAEANAAATEGRAAQNHNQAGDPAVFGQVVVELAHAEKPPTLMGVGSDAVQVLKGRATDLRQNADEWHDLAVSTDIAK